MVQDSVFTLHDGDSVLHEDANPLPLPACPFPSRPTVRTLSHLLSPTAKLTASGLVPPCWHADVSGPFYAGDHDAHGAVGTPRARRNRRTAWPTDCVSPSYCVEAQGIDATV